jgi:glutathionyl-hydroquinone reductase
VKNKSLPPSLTVKFGKFVWTTMWQLMMSQLAPRDKTGAYIRPNSSFRNFVGKAAENPFGPATGRYRLFVGKGCPWAHRTLVTRALKGLEDAVAVSVAFPGSGGMWELESETFGCNTMPEIYQLAQPGYNGRSTVPVLWDDVKGAIVNNESSEIIVMLNSEFNEFARHPELELYPVELRENIDRWNEKIYHAVNNGVYRCGFAQTQAAYDAACTELFAVLDEIDRALLTNRYLCGNSVTLADVRLFTTLFRFDAVYYSLFKCSLRRIQDYQNLSGYLRDLYQLPGVAATCDLDAVKRDYYGNLFPLNPGGIVPVGPDLANFLLPHDRAIVNS